MKSKYIKEKEILGSEIKDEGDNVKRTSYIKTNIIISQRNIQKIFQIQRSITTKTDI